MFKADPKHTTIALYERPHMIHGLKQGNPFSISKSNLQSLPNQTTKSKKFTPTTPKCPLTSSMSKPDSKPPNITLYESHHWSHVPRSPFITQQTLTPLLKKVAPHQSNPSSPTTMDPNNPKISNRDIPHGSNGLKLGNPWPKSKTIS